MNNSGGVSRPVEFGATPTSPAVFFVNNNDDGLF
jgi:hypothetical protein